MKLNPTLQRNINSTLIGVALFIGVISLIEMGINNASTPGLIKCHQGRFTVFINRDEIVSFRSIPDGRTRLELINGKTIFVDDSIFSIVSKFN